MSLTSNIGNRPELEEKLEWRHWVTPKDLRSAPIHRWFVFPHSFTYQLVGALVDEWDLDNNDLILDPFVGAGTTLLTAKQKGVPAIGFDLSPLAVFVSNTKVANYDVEEILSAWSKLKTTIASPASFDKYLYPERLIKAFGVEILDRLQHIKSSINNSLKGNVKDFFLLALIASLQNFSRAKVDGGWFRWVDKQVSLSEVTFTYSQKVEQMINDLKTVSDIKSGGGWSASLGDVRDLPELNQKYTAVITSPPYPNRHDYTRVFHIELLFLFLGEDQIKDLRYQSFHSHVESKPNRPKLEYYERPTELQEIFKRMEKEGIEPRIHKMIDGYFKDIFLSLNLLKRQLAPKSPIAFVVGNARYGGIAIPVDELVGIIGKKLGLNWERIIAVRYRGNSAQQMGKFGKIPSRESIVILRTQ